MALHHQSSDPILLGSGELYLSTEISNPENITEADEAKLVNIGAIESGAELNIGSDALEVFSANRGLIKKLSIKKNIKFSTGMMTWKMDNLAKFILGSKVTEDAVNKTRKTVIGLKDNSPQVYLRFVHDKEDGGQLIINIYKAQFDGDLTFAFAHDKPTTFNYDFVGLATDNKNYLEIIETIPGDEGEEE